VSRNPGVLEASRKIAEPSSWLHRFAVFLCASTLVLIFAGGLVTSTGSGLAVPDWPLSYGQFFPPMAGGVLFEHGHRMVAATVGFLTVIMAVWLWRREPRRWLRRLGVLALLVVVAQGILGGVTVLLRLPLAVSVSHAGLAQIFFCLTVCLALFTSQSWGKISPGIEDSGVPSLRSLAAATTLLIYLQVLLGALMRHTASGLAIPDFPLAYGHLVPPILTRQILIHYAHRIGAVFVTCSVAWLAWRVFGRFRSERTLCRHMIFLIAALAGQILLGAFTIWSSREVIITTLHVAGGALTLAASLLITLRVRRMVLPRRSVVSPAAACAHTATE
jgi:cytochrome c oxidase assembly protein subunit 15